MKSQEILKHTLHRPFPVPPGPWIMRQSWRYLLFAHWPLTPEAVRASIPQSLELDTFDGQAWIGVVPFSMNDVCPRFTPPMPWISNFLELNVRTYVRKNGVPGVYFFSLDCSNPVAVRVARRSFYLPYFDATMQLKHGNNNEIVYSSRRTGAPDSFQASYRPTGPVKSFDKDSLEIFLTERYCLYSVAPNGTLYRGNIHHVPWSLQPAEAEISLNTMLTGSLGLTVPNCQPHLLYSENIDTVEWMLNEL